MRPWPRAAVATLAFVAALAAPATGRAQSPEEELAQRYAPVVRLVERAEPCGHGEP